MTGLMQSSIKTDELCISFRQAIPWTLDGEFGGEQTRIEICKLYRALEIRVEEAG